MMSPIKLPKWLSKLPKHERAAARTRFLLRLSALYATEDGTVKALSTLIGYTPNSLGVASGRDAIPPNAAIKIEKAVGADILTRDQLNPDHFVIGG